MFLTKSNKRDIRVFQQSVTVELQILMVWSLIDKATVVQFLFLLVDMN